MKEYVALGLDKEIVDPDDGKNIARKVASLQSSGTDLSHHPNLAPSPAVPVDGWTSDLSGLPDFYYPAIFRHFVERPCTEIVEQLPRKDVDDDGEPGDSTSSFRGLAKGFRFFKDGHVQSLEMHHLPNNVNFCYVRAKVLPSMVKTRQYQVRVCLTTKGDVHTAYCVCPAGLGGMCNHVGATLYALEDFVRLGLREESRLPCTSRLQKWNQPRKRSVPPSRVAAVHAIKEEYGKGKRRRIPPQEDPRPDNVRLPNPEEVDTLHDSLRAEHEQQLRADKSGNVAKYGSSCLLRLMETTDEEESSSEEENAEDSDSSSDSATEDGLPVDGASPVVIEVPKDYFDHFVAISAEAAQCLEGRTRAQSENMEWHKERRKRVTATMVKKVVCRRSENFAALVRLKLEGTFVGSSATRYGKKNEALAVAHLASVLKKSHDEVSIRSTGLVVDEADPWLAATPDGIVYADGERQALVEVKCPYSARDFSIEEAVSKCKGFCLEKRESGGFALKKVHEYFYQVQTQMHVCKCFSCYFVVWTPKEAFIEEIGYDERFVINFLPKLKKFYFDELLPALTAEYLR